MGIIVDIVVFLIVAISIFIGYKRGLIKCAIHLLSFFIALILVLILTNPISNFVINNTQIDDNMKSTIASNLHLENKENQELDEENSDVPQIIRDHINETVINPAKEASNNVTDAVAENITEIIIKVSVAIIIYIIVRIVLIFINVIADIVGNIPLIKQFNKLGGLIYGIISGIVFLYIVFAIISLASPLIENFTLIDAINDSTIASSIYNNNFLLKLFF